MTSLTFATTSLLRHRPALTFVTVALVIIASSTLVITLSASDQIKGLVKEQEAKGLVVATFGADRMPFSYVGKLKQVPGLEKAIDWARFEHGSTKANDEFPVVACTDGFIDRMPSTLIAPTPDVLARWRADRLGLIAAGGLADREGWKVGDTLNVQSAGSTLQTHLIGKAAATFDDRAFMHFEYLDAVDPGKVDQLTIDCTPSTCGAIAKTVDGVFENSDPAVYVVPAASLSAFMLQGVSAVPSLIEKIGILMALISLVVTGSTLSMSVRERTREFGTLRALGYQRMKVFNLIVLQSVITCVIGGVIGAGVPFLLYHQRGISFGEPPMNNIIVSPSTFALGVGVSIVFGFVVALLPALRMTRLDVVRAVADQG